MNLMPERLYKLTPREYGNLIAGRERQLEDELQLMAVQALMYRKAMNKKIIKFKDLIGDKKTSSISKRYTLEAKKLTLDELEQELGVPQ